jgi:ubiquinone/menaquinone biosynthesis C-methylase UbiE
MKSVNIEKVKYEEATISYTHSLDSAWKKDESRKINYIAKLLVKLEARIHKLNKKNISILDIGCGTGNILNFFSNNGYKKLYGIDINKYTLSIATKNCPQAVIKYGDIYKIPFDKNKFDIVILTEVIEHLDHPEVAIIEIKRVLKKNGVLLLTTPNRMGLMGLSNGPLKFITHGYWYKSILRILGFITCGPEHPKEYFAFELSKKLKSLGFTRIYFPLFCYFPFYPAGRYYLFAQKI